MNNPIYTIGHSNHEWRKLLNLLQKRTIDVVCDVRSHPYSQFNPQFNREVLRDSLKTEKIAYIYLGRELGGRPEDKGCYENGLVQYDRVALSTIFRQGMARLKKGRETHRLALMCSEKDPLNCHRMLLVSRQLAQEGIPVYHVLATGELETQEQALDRLIESLGISPRDLFRSRNEAIRIAYATQAGKIAYGGKQGNPERNSARNKSAQKEVR